jgi:hypothetical protein
VRPEVTYRVLNFVVDPAVRRRCRNPPSLALAQAVEGFRTERFA